MRKTKLSVLAVMVFAVLASSWPAIAQQSCAERHYDSVARVAAKLFPWVHGHQREDWIAHQLAVECSSEVVIPQHDSNYQGQ
jgi:hypothetical protein